MPPLGRSRASMYIHSNFLSHYTTPKGTLQLCAVYIKFIKLL